MTGGDWLRAQYSVLGCVLLWPETAPRVLLETSEADFDGPCKSVYGAVKKLHANGEPVDPISVNHALGNRYGDFLRELMEVVPTQADLGQHIRICREQSRAIAVRTLGNRISVAETIDEMRTLLEQASGLLVEKPGLQIVTMRDAVQSFYQRKSESVRYLEWPVAELNDRLYASAGDFIIIGGYPSTGKSAWSLQCAKYFAGKCKVGFFSQIGRAHV